MFRVEPTPLMVLPPLFRPLLVRLTGVLPGAAGVMVMPLGPVTVLLPAASAVVTLFTAKSFFRPMVTSPF